MSKLRSRVLAAVVSGVAACAGLISGAAPASANTQSCYTDQAGLVQCSAYLVREVTRTAGDIVMTTDLSGRAYWQRGGTRGKLTGAGCSTTVPSAVCGYTGTNPVVPTSVDHLTYLTVTAVGDAQWSGTSTGRRELLSPTTLLIRNRGAQSPFAETSYSLRFTHGPTSQLTNDTRARYTFGTQVYDLRALRTVNLYG
jgi:hypothetical protein